MISCKVLCRYVDTICSVWYLSILFIIGVLVINLISSFGFPIYVLDLMTTHVTSFGSSVSGLCNVVQWYNGMSIVKCCDNNNNNNNNNNNLFNIPEIHRCGYRTCCLITTDIVQNEKMTISYI